MPKVIGYGDLPREVVPVLKRELRPLAQEADTSGIAALIDLFRVMKTRQRGDRIGLINVPKKIKNLFVISKAKEFFKEYSSEEKAMKALT